MTLATDLLDRAATLATLDPSKPLQANLRGAISSAYYALFHAVIEAAVTTNLGSSSTPPARELRSAMSRWYGHAQMKQTAGWFSKPSTAPGEIAALLGHSKASPLGHVPPELANVARAFRDLQEARHRADYDVSVRFLRTEARNFVDLARSAFSDWQRVAGTPMARLFLLLLLTGARPVQPR